MRIFISGAAAVAQLGKRQTEDLKVPDLSPGFSTELGFLVHVPVVEKKLKVAWWSSRC